MKKLIYILLAYLAVVTAVSCQNDFEPVQSSRKLIKSFVLSAKLNTEAGLTRDALTVMTDTEIILFVPYNCTDYSAFVPSFELSDRAAAFIGDKVQDSGKDVVDFSTPVSYTILAENGQKADYIVKVVPTKPFLSYGISTQYNPSISENSITTLDEENRTITVELPAGSDLGVFKPDFTLPDGYTASLGGKIQTSGEDEVDMREELVYTISNGDNYNQEWRIKTIVHIVLKENDILSFRLAAATNPSAFRDAEGIVDKESHSVTLYSYWADPTHLIPEFTLSRFATLRVGDVQQTSGISAQDFSSPVTYTVIAENGDPQEWVVKLAKPKKFWIPDATFRRELKAINSGIFEDDSLVIARAMAWNTGTLNMNDKNVGDYSGIEYLANLTILHCAQSRCATLDLSKNNKINFIQWWFSDFSTLDISNSKGADSNHEVMINGTAGPKIKRFICRNVIGVNILGSATTDAIEYIDYRGGTGTYDTQGNLSFAANAKVLMSKTTWDAWPESRAAKKKIKAATNITLELYAADGTTIVETLTFN